MKTFYLLFAITLLSGCSYHDSAAAEHSYPLVGKTPLFKTDTVFKNPESIVFDPVTRQLFVSNVNGHPLAKDGNGFISKVAINGDIRDLHWITGLNAPKGMTIIGDILYVADIDRLVVIDMTNNNMDFHPVQGALFLNDISHDEAGNVYISDFMTDTIHLFENGALSVWLSSDELLSPNGLYAAGGLLYIGNWGRMVDGFKTKEAGHLIGIDLRTKQITTIAEHLGNLDGLGKYEDFFIVTDFMAGTLFVLDSNGQIKDQIKINKTSADLCVLPEDWELLVIPVMNENRIEGFSIKYSK